MTDIFDTLTMLEAVEQMTLPRRFLMNTFFNAANPETFGTEAVTIDIIKGQRKMAPFVHPSLPGSVSLRKGMESATYKPPYIQPKRPTRAEQILKRAPGDNPFSARTPAERAGEMLGRDLVDLDEEITRSEEWMCAQALTTGRVRVVGEGVDDTIDLVTPMASRKANIWFARWIPKTVVVGMSSPSVSPMVLAGSTSFCGRCDEYRQLLQTDIPRGADYVAGLRAHLAVQARHKGPLGRIPARAEQDALLIQAWRPPVPGLARRLRMPFHPGAGPAVAIGNPHLARVQINCNNKARQHQVSDHPVVLRRGVVHTGSSSSIGSPSSPGTIGLPPGSIGQGHSS